LDQKEKLAKAVRRAIMERKERKANQDPRAKLVKKAKKAVKETKGLTANQAYWDDPAMVDHRAHRAMPVNRDQRGQTGRE
jgi:hypothetical protein